MLHGLFHRIQAELGFTASNGFNEHLDTLEGRVWMQLEWRALRRALESSGSDRGEAIGDALAFRRERRRLFPDAADNERREEIKEGLPSYTGVAAWANSPADAHRAAAPPANIDASIVGALPTRRDPPTVCCWTISCRDGAGRFVATRTLATCSPPQTTGH